MKYSAIILLLFLVIPVAAQTDDTEPETVATEIAKMEDESLFASRGVDLLPLLEIGFTYVLIIAGAFFYIMWARHVLTKQYAHSSLPSIDKYRIYFYISHSSSAIRKLVIASIASTFLSVMGLIARGGGLIPHSFMFTFSILMGILSISFMILIAGKTREGEYLSKRFDSWLKDQL